MTFRIGKQAYDCILYGAYEHQHGRFFQGVRRKRGLVMAKPEILIGHYDCRKTM